ncbi:MAG: type I DNA topoisomerase [Thiobacillus sp.]|uniref:type I DNA topoisomerase n=1 Tax=Thiobacillus sp. TaxID=924 RepID=UPI0027341D23|nr:type I DNA topoisomerase [Thiobacillus sp.]MDP3584074.1 type I DNA topoisomerase [Thiobacillus sp.]
MSKLVIVESPSKSKSLKKYLGDDYDILASYGHVRDLEPKTGAVDTETFAMKYQVIERNAKHVEAIVKAAKKADLVLLATDPDREGEAISWHISEILKERKVKTPMKRVAFYEITESAIQDAVRNPREIASDLVDAQQARRALDYLVGFNLSPLLWKKISPGLSAGRVQSPALRMIVERELEIEAFDPREYWTLHLDSHKGSQAFTAKLTHFRGEKLEQFTVEHEARSKEWLATLEAKDARVMRIEKKRRSRNPAAPFTTSTLQQAGVRQLGMTTDRVMRTAQQLYEGVDLGEGPVGLITYMRTDSVNLAQEAITDIRKYVSTNFDKDFLPPAAIAYKAKTKNAQEAHEAVRPTAVMRTPEAVKPFLTHDQIRLYELIWKRTVACQMTPAQFDTVAADITVGEGTFRATGQTLAFAGFLAVYQDDEEEEGESKLPALVEGETLPVDKLYGEQHFTQPPPRYTEASLVKALEEHGIGRPSTYASIISTLQDREYVVLEKKRFQPTDIGRLVNCFLTRHFSHYVDYDFTAKLEDKLDDVSNGTRVWSQLLGEFWKGFDGELKAKQDVERGCPIMEPCPKCSKPLFMQASKRGLFIGCSGYPECDYTRPLHAATAEGDNILGKDPATGLDVKLLSGRFGPYVQIGEMPEDKKAPKPRRASWPKDIPLDSATLELALKFLSLPREVGHHPTTGLPIVANNGRFGPYLLHDGKFKSIPKADSVYEINLARALEVLAMEREPRGDSAASVLKNMGPHPEDGKDITVRSGRYGPYVKHGSTNATLPKDITPEEITLDEALGLIAARVAKGPAKKPARKTAAKPAAAKKAKTSDADAKDAKKPAAKKKPATKKAPAKAATAKKPAGKKPAA